VNFLSFVVFSKSFAERKGAESTSLIYRSDPFFTYRRAIKDPRTPWGGHRRPGVHFHLPMFNSNRPRSNISIQKLGTTPENTGVVEKVGFIGPDRFSTRIFTTRNAREKKKGSRQLQVPPIRLKPAAPFVAYLVVCPMCWKPGDFPTAIRPNRKNPRSHSHPVLYGSGAQSFTMAFLVLYPQTVATDYRSLGKNLFRCAGICREW
jgi:hypothetical protein